ncbi:MAG: hypothetical protein HKN50_01960 [Gammaproteobacteria bacterium]|nr:hypothetical protein [Gammaproteobacteria bacterium]
MTIELPRTLLNRCKFIAVLAAAFFVVGCQTSGGSGGGVPSPSPSKSPTMPSPGGGGAPSPSQPGEQSEGEQSQGEQSGGEGQQGSSQSGSESDSTAIPDEWEQEGEADADGDGAGEGEETGDAEDESQPSFEEPQSGSDAAGETAFEQPDFGEDGGMTEQEMKELEKELDESLGDFDEEIQREKTYAEERANDNADEGTLGGVGTFETYEGDGEGAASKRQRQASSSSNKTGQASASSSSDADAEGDGGDPGLREAKQSDAAGNVDDALDEELAEQKDDIPDLRDNDDIVARQIREAAERETDPELRKKLWEEYRRYKNQ